MKNILISSWLLSCFILLILNITFGTYYEGYESIYNALILGEFSSRIDYSLFLPNWFGMLPLISFFSEFLHTAHAYSWTITILNLFILASLTSCFFLLFKYERIPRIYAIIVYIIFLIFFSENLIYAYNMRISFWALVTAYFLIFIIKRYHLGKLTYLPVVILVMISISSRLEIAFITSLILLAVTLLLQPRLLRASILLFFAVSSVFAFYKIYEHQIYPQYETLLEIEHAFEDQQRVVPSEAKDIKTQLLLTAMGSYIWDDEVFTMTDCAKIVQSGSLVSYMQSEKFPEIYLGKLKQLASLLKDYIGLLILSVLLFSYALYFYLKKQANLFSAFLRISGLILFMIILVLVLNLLIICPHNFIVVCGLGADLLCLVYLLLQHDDRKMISRIGLIFLIILQFPLTSLHSMHLYNYEQDNKTKAQTLRTILLELNNQKKTIVFAHTATEQDYPTRLFSNMNKIKLNLYCCDFFLSRYPFFKAHNEEFFGKGYSSMRSKMNSIANHDNVVFLSNDEYNAFITQYMLVFHKVRLKFIELHTNASSPDLKVYSVFQSEDR